MIRKRIIVRQCKRCKGPIPRGNPRAIYCSQKCRQPPKPKKTPKLCEKCGRGRAPRQKLCYKCKPKKDRREYQWKKRGIKDGTVARYNYLFEQQGGVCAICLRPPKKRRLALDHDHKTGKSRGLLCYNCNYGLRFFEWFNKTPGLLQRTLKYLRVV